MPGGSAQELLIMPSHLTGFRSTSRCRDNPIRGLGPLIMLALWLVGCQGPNHFLIHPRVLDSDLHTRAEIITQDELRITLEWVMPNRAGPSPTVLVHPEAGGRAADMRGVLADLARAGYVAVAADYQRLLNGEFRRNLFAWRAQHDVTRALAIVRQRPEVDPERIAVLGFSQGGVYSLLIAAHAPRQVRAVVAYYPVTDFDHWLRRKHANPLRALVYRIIRWHFRKESGAHNEQQFQTMLAQASPLPQADTIRAPVLLIHGEQDTSAAPEESERMAQRLRQLGREVQLVLVGGAGHVFNFKDPLTARATWMITLEWLETHVKHPTQFASDWDTRHHEDSYRADARTRVRQAPPPANQAAPQAIPPTKTSVISP